MRRVLNADTLLPVTIHSLEKYKTAVKNSAKNFQTLQPLIEDDATEKMYFAELQKAYRDKLVELDKTIELRRTKGFAVGVAAIKEGTGARDMEQIRQIISLMSQQEQSILTQRSTEARVSLQRASLAFYGTLFAALITVSALFYVFRRYVILRTREEEQYWTLHAVMATSLDNIYVYNTRGQYRYVSEGGARVLGFSPEDMIGKTGKELGQQENSSNIASK